MAVFLVKDNDQVRSFYSEPAMQAAGFTQADEIVTDEEFNSKGCYARIIGGEIVIGQTAQEIQAGEVSKQIGELKGQLQATDYIAAKIAEGAATVEEYAEQTAQRQAWREQINALEASIS